MKKLNLKLKELLKNAELEVILRSDELTSIEKSQIKGGDSPIEPPVECWCSSHKVFRD